MLGSAISSCGLRPGALGGGDVAREVLGLPGEALAHACARRPGRRSAASASRSPVCQAPLMNCTTPTRRPWPSMRSARPKAAVDLPLPGPVWTMSRPFSIGLLGDLGVLHGLALGHLGAMAFGFGVVDGLGHGVTSPERQAGDHEDHAVGARGDALVEAALQRRGSGGRARCRARCRGRPRWRPRTTGRTAVQRLPRGAAIAASTSCSASMSWSARASGSRPARGALPAVAQARRQGRAAPRRCASRASRRAR